MAFRITDVRTTSFPSEEAVSGALGALGLAATDITGPIERFICGAALTPDVGYQQSIARELEDHFASQFQSGEHRIGRRARYHSELNEQADIAIGRPDSDKQVFIEIEFRPNVEKDLIKFQIGRKSGRLACAVLILALDRNVVNPG